MQLVIDKQSLRDAICSEFVLDNYKLIESVLPCSVATGRQYSVGNILMWMLQMAKAIDYIHSLKVTSPQRLTCHFRVLQMMHRDIKLVSILLDASQCNARLADLNLATDDERSNLSTTASTAKCIAPEVRENGV